MTTFAKPLIAATALAALALAGCNKPGAATNTASSATTASAAPAGEPVVPAGKTQAPAGTYTLDHPHSTVVFRLSHLGFSKYTASFGKLDGQLTFDPDHPEKMAVSATIDPQSLTLQAPPAGFHDALTGAKWLDAGKYPQITFKSTKVTSTGANTADVAGDFTLHGVTRPVVLHVTFNGGYAPNAFDGARVGFSGKTSIKRSDFGIGGGLPAPGTNFGVGDNLDVTLETEWNSGKPTGGPLPPLPKE
ncbi:MAG TPA: YceI family protein [Phenylobacterium sp.]|jgi:polyisoprenoid-binding protein YceI|nr:YceI family protein [Phenylobacterium sp.]